MGWGKQFLRCCKEWIAALNPSGLKIALQKCWTFHEIVLNDALREDVYSETMQFVICDSPPLYYEDMIFKWKLRRRGFVSCSYFLGKNDAKRRAGRESQNFLCFCTSKIRVDLDFDRKNWKFLASGTIWRSVLYFCTPLYYRKPRFAPFTATLPPQADKGRANWVGRAVQAALRVFKLLQQA